MFSEIQSSQQCTYLLLSHRLTPRTPPGNSQEPRGNGTVLVFLFSPWGRGFAVFEQLRWTTGAYPWDLFEAVGQAR